jgi:hypothetical protein
MIWFAAVRTDPVATRQPTVIEAAEHVCRSLTLEYRRECIRYWREKFGGEYADQVEAEVRRRWGKKK